MELNKTQAKQKYDLENCINYMKNFSIGNDEFEWEKIRLDPNRKIAFAFLRNLRYYFKNGKFILDDWYKYYIEKKHNDKLHVINSMKEMLQRHNDEKIFVEQSTKINSVSEALKKGWATKYGKLNIPGDNFSGNYAFKYFYNLDNDKLVFIVTDSGYIIGIVSAEDEKTFNNLYWHLKK